MKSKFLSCFVLLVLINQAYGVVIFDSNTTIEADDYTYDEEDIIIDDCVLTVNGQHDFNSMHIKGYATVTHTVEYFNGFDLFITGDLTIDANGMINVDGKGYTSTGPGGGEASTWYGSGGGYGGCGGRSVDKEGGGSYGSVCEPNELGSGGGRNRRGGGAICVTVGGTLTVNGDITANGITSDWSAAGGGSGGSIWIEAGTLADTGVITANGGDTIGSGSGGGGGGRIAIYYDTWDFSGSVSVEGGSGGYEAGGTGTIYYQELSQEYGDLILDGGGVPGNVTVLPAGDNIFNMVDVFNEAILYVPEDSNLVVLQDDYTLDSNGTIIVEGRFMPYDQNNFGLFEITTGGELFINGNGVVECNSLSLSLGGIISLSDNGHLEVNDVDILDGGIFEFNKSETIPTMHIYANGLLTHFQEEEGFDLYITGDLTIDSNGMIDVSGKGYTSTGPGGGKASTWYGSGGGYGGEGGQSVDLAGGDPYGFICEPNDLGSGGGRNRRGGGAIRVTVEGTLTINGDITANGITSDWEAAGGGSGGSIWIEAGTLSGTGAISANGGDTIGSGSGGGGGGRIAIYYDTWDFSGSVSVEGGSGGYEAGGTGTIYYQELSQEYGDLILDGGGVPGNVTVLPAGDNIFNMVDVFNEAILYVPEDSNLVVLQDDYTLDSNGTIIVEGRFMPYDQNNFGLFEITTGGELFINGNGVVECNSLSLSLGGIISLSDNGHLEVNDVDILDGGIFEFNKSETIPTMHIYANGLLTHFQEEEGFDLYITGDLTIDSNGMIDVSGKGYTSTGPGGGKASTWYGSGGGYGGEGGQSVDLAGGDPYGFICEPNDLGSGGGRNRRGGGAIRVTVEGTLTINGDITANGITSDWEAAGGGSGGSIWIEAGTLSGTGAISANGGDTIGSGSGGGGGGRIAIYCYSNFFNGTISVDGGTGYENGEEGTIFIDKLFYSIDSGHYKISSGGDFELKAICGQPEHRILSGGVFTLTGGFLTDLDGAAPMCMDGIDNDGDGDIDFPNDAGCLDALDISELTADYNQDEKVDVEDVALLADYWMTYAYELDVAPAPEKDNIINFKDFAVMAGNWLEGL